MGSETQDDSNASTSHKLSQLSKMITNFVVESARKTHDSLEDEHDKKHFLSNLSNALLLTNEEMEEMDAKQQQQQEKIHYANEEKTSSSTMSKTDTVINFLVETSQGTLKSIQGQEERNSFKKYLRSSFTNEFVLPQ